MIDLRLGSYEDCLKDQIQSIDLLFTSPPYNIGSGGPRVDGFRHRGGKDKKSYGGITGYKDTLREGDYQDSQIAFLRWCVKALKEDGVLVYNHKPRRKNGVMIHPMQWLLAVPDLVLMEEIIWDRRSTHNHDNHLFWPTTERLYVLRKADGRYRYENNGNVRDLQFRDDHWDIPLNPRKATDKNHACPFDTRLADNVIKAFSNPGDLVCDPYSGSGTTAASAQRLDRNFVGSELDAKYHRESLKRLNAVQRELV